MAIQQEAALADMNNNDERSHALMLTFNTLMAEGTYNVMYNGGMGDIDAIIAPFYDAYTVAKQARATNPRALSPHVGMQYAQASGFLSQTLSYEELKEFRFMSALEDVDRQRAVPGHAGDRISQRREVQDSLGTADQKRRGRLSLEHRSEAQQILNKLDQEVNIPLRKRRRWKT